MESRELNYQEPEAFGYCWHRNNGEFYYGIHRGELDDRYAGSGTVFKDKFGGVYKSQCKNPDEWERTIEFRGTYEACIQWEIDTVTTEMVETDLCLNQITGGNNLVAYSEASRKKMREAHKNRTEYYFKPGWTTVEECKRRSEYAKANHNGAGNPNAKSVTTPFGSFNTLLAATKAAGVSKPTMIKRLKSDDYPTYYYNNR